MSYTSVIGTEDVVEVVATIVKAVRGDPNRFILVVPDDLHVMYRTFLGKE